MLWHSGSPYASRWKTPCRGGVEASRRSPPACEGILWPTTIAPHCLTGPTGAEEVKAAILDLVHGYRQPSAGELVAEIERRFGLEARWELEEAVTCLSHSIDLSRSERDYLCWLLASGSLTRVLRGVEAPDREAISTIDSLLRQSMAYATSEAFQEMVSFVGRFRDYAPLQ